MPSRKRDMPLGLFLGPAFSELLQGGIQHGGGLHGTVCERAEPQPCRAFQEPRAALLLLQRAGD